MGKRARVDDPDDNLGAVEQIISNMRDGEKWVDKRDYTRTRNHLIDNIMLSLQEKGVSMNVITEQCTKLRDLNNTRAEVYEENKKFIDLYHETTKLMKSNFTNDVVAKGFSTALIGLRKKWTDKIKLDDHLCDVLNTIKEITDYYLDKEYYHNINAMLIEYSFTYSKDAFAVCAFNIGEKKFLSKENCVFLNVEE